MKRKTCRPKRVRSKRVKSKRVRSKHVRPKRGKSKRVRPKRVRSKRVRSKRVRSKRVISKRVSSKWHEGNKVLKYMQSGGSENISALRDNPLTLDDIPDFLSEIENELSDDDNVLKLINKYRVDNNLSEISKEQLDEIGDTQLNADKTKKTDIKPISDKELKEKMKELRTHYWGEKGYDNALLGSNPRRNIAALEYNFETEPINKTEYNWNFDCNNPNVKGKSQET